VIVSVKNRRFVGLPGPSVMPCKAKVVGYIATSRKRNEYWISGPTIREVVGGRRVARALNGELHEHGLLETDRRPPASATPPLPDGISRSFLVVVRHQPKKPRALDQALAAAAPV